jgi:hypothetical protein
MKQDLHPGPLEPSEATDLRPGPLHRATDEASPQIGPLDAGALQERGVALLDPEPLRPGPLEPSVGADEVRPAAAPAPTKVRKSWRQQRRERRRRRVIFEEVLGWILVPLILVGGYVGIKGLLGALGTSPTALIQGIQMALSGRGG